MSETETEIGWRIARGELPSPQFLSGFALFSLRFSGTGTAWRASLSEHVFRAPEEYLTPEMCARLAGVPVVAVHPEAGSLDTDAYVRTVIGAISIGYVAGADGILSSAGDELWCIARVNDAGAAEAMATGELSTSPAVTFGADSGNQLLPLQDGTRMLIEGAPATIDHLAAALLPGPGGRGGGVWDRGGPPTGIRTDSVKEPTMSETMTDRKDASPGEQPDKMLTALDAISKRLDALEAGRKDAMAEQPAQDIKNDAEHEEWKRDDAAQCERDDADEKAEREEMEAKGEAKEVAADKARKSRKDRMKARADAKRRLDAQTRADAAMMTQAEAAQRRKTETDNLDAQARADAVCHAWGMTAPPAMQGEATLAYRVRLARYHQQHCTEPSFKTLDLGALAASQPAALDGIERRIYADSAAAAASPTIDSDHIVYRTSVDPITGHRVTEGRGRHTFIHDLKRPSQRVTAFLTPSHRAA